MQVMDSKTLGEYLMQGGVGLFYYGLYSASKKIDGHNRYLAEQVSKVCESGYLDEQKWKKLTESDAWKRITQFPLSQRIGNLHKIFLPILFLAVGFDSTFRGVELYYAGHPEKENFIGIISLIDLLPVALFTGAWFYETGAELVGLPKLAWNTPICAAARRIAPKETEAEAPATEPASEFHYSDIVPARQYNWFNSAESIAATAFAAAGLAAIGITLSDIIATANGIVAGILPNDDDINKATNSLFAPDS